MSALIILPRMGETMESGRVTAWLKKPGDNFQRGETIAEIETDKVTVEMPALDSGTLVEILVPEGAEVVVGAPLGRYDSAGASRATAPNAAASTEGRASPDASARPAPATLPGAATSDQELMSPQPPAAIDATERRRATPVARRLASRSGLDLSDLSGSGRRGRIEKRDVDAAMASRTPVFTAPSSLPELQSAPLPQGLMAYREWAPLGVARRTVLLLHGFSADGAAWASVASGLARGGARVIAPDLPGHGMTGIKAINFDGVTGAVAAFVRSLRLVDVEILGHSMGGAVATKLVATSQIKPKAMTLVAPAGLGGEIDADFVRGMAEIETRGALAHLLRRLAQRPPTFSRPQLDAMAAQLATRRLRQLATCLAPNGRQGIDIVSDLAAVTAPIRIIWGLEDRIIPWTHVAAAPSRAAIHLIADAGHMPHWDKPQNLAALLE
jgi:pyruvate dehydrogenase E2 component (dihydrolipoamide acetyltransferase)